MGGHITCIRVCHSLAVTPLLVLPSAAFCKVAFPTVSSVTPVLSPGDLSHSWAMLVTPGLQAASQRLARLPGHSGEGGLARSFLPPCPCTSLLRKVRNTMQSQQSQAGNNCIHKSWQPGVPAPPGAALHGHQAVALEEGSSCW